MELENGATVLCGAASEDPVVELVCVVVLLVVSVDVVEGAETVIMESGG